MLKSKPILAVLAATALLPACAVAKRPIRHGSAAGQRLCRRLNDFNEAWLHADFKDLERFLAPDYVHTDDHGTYQPRATWLKVMHTRTPNLKTLTIDMHDVRIRMLGHTAVVTGEDVIGSTVHKSEPPEYLRFTQVWVDHTDGWQRLAFQATPVIDNMKFSHMKCTKSDPSVCTGHVKVTLPGTAAKTHGDDDANRSVKQIVPSCRTHIAKP